MAHLMAGVPVEAVRQVGVNMDPVESEALEVAEVDQAAWAWLVTARTRSSTSFWCLRQKPESSLGKVFFLRIFLPDDIER